MNVEDFIRRNGNVKVPNPKYNPKSKKNVVPATITVPDVGQVSNSFTDNVKKTMLKDYAEGWSVDNKTAQKYENYGLNYNPREYQSGVLDEQIADRQSNFSKAFNAVAQTVVSEVGLGSVRAFSDLIDGIINVASGEENDYTNPVSQKVQEWQEAFRNEVAPIYTTPGVNISNGGLGDFGWWMSNFPSIASSLTLLLPSTAVIKAVGWAAKATKLTKGIGNTRKFLTQIDKVDEAAKAGKELGALEKVSRWANSRNVVGVANTAIKYGATATLSRVMENYQEASQVMNDLLPQMYEGDGSVTGIKDMSEQEYQNLLDRNSELLEGVDTSDRYAVAKKLAKVSADQTFQIDMLNTIFDAYQLYALRNINKLRNAPTRASVRRAHKNQLKYLGKTDEEIKEILNNRKWYTKAWEGAKDFAIGTRTALTAELTEGVEEAVNYIAQQEGMSYGKMLLSGEAQNDFWDTRLSEYMNDPMLYESAFWGLMGGITFQSLESAFHGVQRAIESKKSDKRHAKKEDGSEEQIKQSFMERFVAPEVKARLDHVKQRGIQFDELVSKLKQIQDKKNPYKKDASGKPEVFANEDEQAVAREKAFTDFETQLMIDAMFVGDFNLTRQFLESDEVRDYLVQKNIVSQEEAVRRQSEMREKTKRLSQLYDSNMRAIANAMVGKDEETGLNLRDIPAEYFQIIAVENIKHQLNAEQYAAANDRYEQTISGEEARLKDELKARGINYREAIRSFVLARELGQIEAELAEAREAHKNDDKSPIDNRTISGQSAIRELELRKKVLEGMIAQSLEFDMSAVPTENKKLVESARRKRKAASLITTLRAVAATEKTTDGYTMNTSSKRYTDLDNALVEAFNANEESWESTKQNLTKINEAFGEFSREEFAEAASLADVFNDKLANALSSEGINTLANLSQNLLDAYGTVTANEIARQIELSHVATDAKSIRHAAHMKHNDIDQLMSGMAPGGRYYVVESAATYLKALAKKYSDGTNDATLAEALAYGTLNKERREELKELLSNEDMEIYDTAMSMLAVYNKQLMSRKKSMIAANMNLPELVKDAIYDSSRLQYEEVEDDTLENFNKPVSENTSTPENSSQSTQTSPPITSSTTTSASTTSNATPQNIDFLHDKKGNKLSIPCAKIIFDSSNTNNPVRLEQIEDGTSPGNAITLTPIEGEEGGYILDANRPQDRGAQLENPYFYTINVPIANGGVVVKRPQLTIDNDGTIIDYTPGVIDDPNNTGEEEGSEGTEGGVEEGSEEGAEGGGVAISPTGEEERTYFESEGTEEDEEAAVDLTAEDVAEPSLKEIAQLEIIKYIAKQQRNGGAYNEDDVKGIVQEALRGKASDEDIANTFNAVRAFGQNQARRKDLEMQPIADLGSFINASEIHDNDSTDESREQLKDALDKILADYAAVAYVEQIEGIKVISLENLLRYCNTIAGDISLGSALYDRFVKAFEASDKYILAEDTNSSDKSSVVSNAALSAQQRFERHLNGAVNGRTLNLGLFEESENSELFDNLKPGTKLSVTVEERNGSRFLSFSLNGKVISNNNKVPFHDGKNKKLLMDNKGWKVDISDDPTNMTSDLETLFINFLVNPDNNPKYEDVTDVIRLLAYNGLTVEENEELVDDLWTQIDATGIDITKYLYAKKDENGKLDFMGTGISNRNTATQFLIDVYKGCKSASDQVLNDANMSREEFDKLIANRRISSIKRFFNLRRDSFIATYTLAENSNLEVEIDTVNEGGIILTSEEDAEPVNKDGVIGSNHKGAVHVVVGSMTEPGVLYSTNPNEGESGRINMPTFGTGNTFISIKKQSGEIALVQAFPQTLGSSDFKKGSVIDEIKNEILNHLTSIVTDWLKDPNKSSKKIKDFIATLCTGRYDASGNRLNNPLMLGFKVASLSNGYNGFQITYKDKDGNNHYIKFFDSYGENNRSIITIDNKIVNKNAVGKFKDIAREQLKFNIEFEYVRGINPLNGFAKKLENGKFAINIPGGREHIFNSFEDFVLTNGVVKVKTKSEDGKTNFHRPGSSEDQYNNSRVTFKIVSKTTRTEPTENIKLGDAVKKLIEDSNDDDLGMKIMERILDSTQLSILKTSKLIKELSIGNIIFVDNIPGTSAYAAYVTSDVNINGQTIEKGNILVTQQWINLLNSNDIASREEAVRHLIHEGVHKKIATLTTKEKEELFNNVRNIFNEFVEANRKDGVSDAIKIFEYNLTPENTSKYYTNGEINERGLEEFLVESLTRPTLIARLNGIATDGKTISNNKFGNIRSKNLFQKILATIAKLFNLNINKGSLLEKEYKLFTKLVTPTTESSNNISKTEAQQATETAINTIIEESDKHIKFDKTSHTYKIDGTPVDASVTQFVSRIFGKRIVSGYDHSIAIGNAYDSVVRDYFSGVDVLNTEYPNLTKDRVKRIAEDMKRFESYLTSRFGENYTVITKEFYLSGVVNANGEEVTVAGATDMLVIDKDGNIHIFDMKTKNHAIDTTYSGKVVTDRRDYTAQQNLYRLLIEAHPELKGKVKSLNLIWADTKYPSTNNVTYTTNDEGEIVMSDDSGKETLMKDDTRVSTPKLKANVEDSIIALDVTDVINNTVGRDQSKKLEIESVEPAITEDNNELPKATTAEEDTVQNEINNAKEAQNALNLYNMPYSEISDNSIQSLKDKRSHKVSSTKQILDVLPIENQSTFERLISRAGIEIKC